MFGFCLSCNVEYNDRFNMLRNRPTRDQLMMMMMMGWDDSNCIRPQQQQQLLGIIIVEEATTPTQPLLCLAFVCSASFSCLLFPQRRYDEGGETGECSWGWMVGRVKGGGLGTPTRCRCMIYIMSLSTTASPATLATRPRNPLQSPISASILESLV